MVRPESTMRVVGADVYLLPIRTRTPLKFGPETLTQVTCARVRVEVENRAGGRSAGWGETPLSVQWVWPGDHSYAERFDRVLDLVGRIARALPATRLEGHPLETGLDFQTHMLPALLDAANREHTGPELMPWLAALLCFSAFDLAAHDAFGNLLGRPTFQTYGPEFLTRDLADLTEGDPLLRGRYPADFLIRPRREELVAWHLVGGLDAIEPSTLDSAPPADGYPNLLRDWIRADGLRCLKVKLRGTDAPWDYERLARVGAIGREEGVEWLSADFNCTVRDPAYVNGILDRLARDQPEVWRMVLYVEQPFPYELDFHRIDVRSVAARKPLFLDESAHDWRHVRLGHELGWTGVALKTCKTLSGALLSACWARARGMSLMVQDLTNPMLAQVSHVLLAAHVPTIMGVETNAMQYYPRASALESVIHPGLYRRRKGRVDLSTITGSGLGYRVDEIGRPLPPPYLAVSGK